jgi:asparagine synthase (glutamine-hydrolysing)
MCGIAGWAGQHPQNAQETAEGMIRALRHRGPDAQRVEIFPSAALIHARLSIIDLSETGIQPMANEDHTIWVVYNGEIYNHHSIRDELERKGHVFRGRADTEILPHLYEECGPNFVERLHGMFTIALYDTRVQRLILARDRFGIKPLFYAPTSTRLAFASEIRALRGLPDVNIQPDSQAISDFAALFYIPAPQTFYQGIRALQPGELLEAEMQGDRVSWTTRRYFHWQIAPDFNLTLEQATEQAEALLQNGVKHQLESDVPLGALLSGGIDSSLISAYAQRSLSNPLKTFNARFADKAFDETWAAQAVAQHIGSEHHTLTMDDDRGTWEKITSALNHAGQPFADTSLFGVDNICRLMRRHVTVALSGDGGDEGFGGYQFYQYAEQFSHLLAIPQWARSGLLPMAGLATSVVGKWIGTPSHLARRLRDAGKIRDDVDALKDMFSWIRDDEHNQLCAISGVLPVRRFFDRQWEYALPRNASRLEKLSAQVTEICVRLLMPDDFLFKVDIASMRNSLEVRVPMLDEDLFNFGLTLPHTLKVEGQTGKLVLRSLARRMLPQQVAEKPKHGFGVPVDAWIDADFKAQLRQTLLGPESHLPEYFNRAAYEDVIQAFCKGQQHPEISRQGLYQRAIMLLSVHLALAGA